MSHAPFYRIYGPDHEAFVRGAEKALRAAFQVEGMLAIDRQKIAESVRELTDGNRIEVGSLTLSLEGVFEVKELGWTAWTSNPFSAMHQAALDSVNPKGLAKSINEQVMKLSLNIDDFDPNTYFDDLFEMLFNEIGVMVQTEVINSASFYRAAVYD